MSDSKEAARVFSMMEALAKSELHVLKEMFDANYKRWVNLIVMKSHSSINTDLPRKEIAVAFIKEIAPSIVEEYLTENGWKIPDGKQTIK